MLTASTYATALSVLAWSLFLSVPLEQATETGSRCIMTMMIPSWVRQNELSSKDGYQVLQYNEGRRDPATLVPHKEPVLFVPGNAGSHGQGRSLGKVLSMPEFSRKRNYVVYCLDFRGEMSAFDGRIAERQAAYLKETIDYLLAAHDRKNITIVGHSMGGVISRRMEPEKIKLLISLSSPATPLLDDVHMSTIYTPLSSNVTVYNFSGGLRDTLVPRSHNFNGIRTHEFTNRPGCDHLSIVWCNQVVLGVARLVAGGSYPSILYPRVQATDVLSDPPSEGAVWPCRPPPVAVWRKQGHLVSSSKKKKKVSAQRESEDLYIIGQGDDVCSNMEITTETIWLAGYGVVYELKVQRGEEDCPMVVYLGGEVFPPGKHLYVSEIMGHHIIKIETPPGCSAGYAAVPHFAPSVWSHVTRSASFSSLLNLLCVVLLFRSFSTPPLFCLASALIFYSPVSVLLMFGLSEVLFHTVTFLAILPQSLKGVVVHALTIGALCILSAAGVVHVVVIQAYALVWNAVRGGSPSVTLLGMVAGVPAVFSCVADCTPSGVGNTINDRLYTIPVLCALMASFWKVDRPPCDACTTYHNIGLIAICTGLMFYGSLQLTINVIGVGVVVAALL